MNNSVKNSTTIEFKNREIFKLPMHSVLGMFSYRAGV